MRGDVGGVAGEVVDVGGERLAELYRINYLGALVYSIGASGEQVGVRIDVERSAFVRLSRRLSAGLVSVRVKLAVNTSLLMGVLRYRCESWSLGWGDE